MLLHELLQELKSVYDFRHKDVFKQLPFWGATKKPEFISSEDGFHFEGGKDFIILASTNNSFYSAVAAAGGINSKHKLPNDVSTALDNAWNQFGGLVSFADKTVTIRKEDAGGKSRQSTIHDVKAAQKTLRALIPYGLKMEFKIKGVPAPHNGMTVQNFLKLKDPVQVVLQQQGQIMYHGTSKKRWDESISKRGLQPGHTGEIYADLIKGYSEHNIYLALNSKTAEFYGKRQALKDSDDQFVVLEVTVPDGAKIMPDDQFAHAYVRGADTAHRAIKVSVKENGSVAYKGSIAAKFIKLLSIKKA